MDYGNYMLIKNISQSNSQISYNSQRLIDTIKTKKYNNTIIILKAK